MKNKLQLTAAFGNSRLTAIVLQKIFILLLCGIETEEQ